MNLNPTDEETGVIDGRICANAFPVRDRNGHKGDYGHVLIVGGSSGFGGAPALAALGALRAGAGLVTAALPASVVNGPIASLAPEAMAHPIVGHRGRLDCNKFLTWLYSRKPFDVIAVGPGLGQNEETAGIVKALLEIEGRRLVIDADALNMIAAAENGLNDIARETPGGERIITPHPGEAARLLQVDVDAINGDRLGAAKKLADLTRAVVVLKGHGTIVCQSGRKPVICDAGNPGMGTGGSGDVLTGMIAALWGQNHDAFTAAEFGVWLHATAGDLAAEEVGEESLVARDIVRYIGKAFKLARQGN